MRRLRMERAVVPNTITVVLMDLHDRTGQVPLAHFNRTESHPVSHLPRFLVFGDGEVAPDPRSAAPGGAGPRSAAPRPRRLTLGPAAPARIRPARRTAGR
ncbi:hypothetical protein GCM10018966_022130 [Streptomyces yanii]